MPSKIVQARTIRGDFVVRVYTSAQLVAACLKYQGTSAADPYYLTPVTLQLMAADYTFTAAQLPLKIRSHMTLKGTGTQQTRLISAQTTSVGAKNVIECVDSYSASGSPGRVFHVTLESFSIIGDAYAPAGIYAKGLNHSIFHDIDIGYLSASGSIGVQLDAELGFGCYYNHFESVAVGDTEPGGGAGSGAGIGFRLKTTDLGAQPKRCNSNSLIMCSMTYCVDAGYEINGTASCVLTSCEAEVNAVGLRVLNAIDTVVLGGYFENNTSSDIQLGELSGASTPATQTCLLRPLLVSTTRLAGLSRGSTGDLYLLANSGTAPSVTKYDGTWNDRSYINELSAGYADFSAHATAVRVGYYKLSGDSNYRMEIYNDGTMTWGSGSGATDIALSRSVANVLQLGDADSFRLNSTGILYWGVNAAGAVDVAMFRIAADILGLANADSFQLNSTGELRWSLNSVTTADAGLKRLTATNCGTVSAIDDCDIRVQGGYNTGRFRLGDYYLHVDANRILRLSNGEPASADSGTDLADADPRLFGALMDGTTDDTVAAQACMDAFGRMDLPTRKSMRINSPLVIPAGLTLFAIRGGPGSKILWTGDTSAQNLWDFATNYTYASPLFAAEFSDFEIVGSHATNLSVIASHPLRVVNTSYVTVNRVKVSYSRIFGMFVYGARFVRVSNCEVHHCARDGIHVSGSVQTQIVDNYVHHCDDDGIACHSDFRAWQIGHEIVGNKILLSQGIRAVGLQGATITGNTIRLFFNVGILLDTMIIDAVETTGRSAAIGNVISGNTILDGLDRANADAVNSGCVYISVLDEAAQAGSLTYIPGLRGTTHFGYLGNVDATAENVVTTPMPISSDIIISNNTMKRTLPRTGMLSSQGHGNFWLRTGDTDYDLTGSSTGVMFIRLGGHLNNVVIDGNICSGEDVWMSIKASNGSVRPMRNVRVTNNIASDIKTNAVICVTTTETLGITFDGNTFDMDPMHVHANRGANGTWTASGVPQVWAPQGMLGSIWTNNDIKNCARLSSTDLATQITGGAISWRGNRIWGTPVASGFSTSNSGVGDIPAVQGNILVHANFDPASASWGVTTRPGEFTSTAIPTTGTYIVGEVVAKATVVRVPSDTARAGYAVLGWERLTTGSAHVAGVDWLERRTEASGTVGATVKTVQTYTPAPAATATLDCSVGDLHRITMPAGNITIALSNVTDGQALHIAITQDGTGSRTVTWFATIRWAGGSAPTLTTTASKRDVIVIMCTGSGTYDGFIAGAAI